MRTVTFFLQGQRAEIEFNALGDEIVSIECGLHISKLAQAVILFMNRHDIKKLSYDDRKIYKSS